MKYIDKLLHKDARLLSRVLKSSSPCVDVTITSPPYWKLKDYGSPNQIGYGQTKKAYLADMKRLLRACLRATKPTGSMWLVIDSYRDQGRLRLLPFEIANIAEDVGWILRDVIVWDKQYTVPWQTNGHLRKTFEYILVLTKSDNYKYYIDRIKTLDEISKWWVDFPERFNPRGITPTSIWSLPFRSKGAWGKESEIDHYCSFPTSLAARIIELTTDPGDLVLDPFAGSGVALALAQVMGRHYVGFELNEEYITLFEEVVKKKIPSEWDEIQKWRNSEIDAKINFEQTILKLRALKFARQATNPIIEANEKIEGRPLRAILCNAQLPPNFEPGQPFSIQISALLDVPSIPIENALRASIERTLHPPLTQYGIQAQLQIVASQEVMQDIEQLETTYYLYPKYKPRSYSAAGLLGMWLREGSISEYSDDSKVPLLANIGVDVAWVVEKYLE